MIDRLAGRIAADESDTGGIGGTLAANALTMAMRATLEQVLTAEAYAHTIPLAERFTAGVEAAAAIDSELDRYLHLAALNRGILLMPFHNMALIVPATTARDIDGHTAVFRESVEQVWSQ